MATTTFLFADQVGSTAQLGELGDADAEPLRAGLMAGLIEATAEHGGRVVDLTGDGLFAAFPSSIDAVAAAINMQSSVAISNEARPHGHRVAIRVGLHTGEPLIDGDGAYFGMAIVVARRLCDLAVAGQILVSDILRGLVKPRQLYDLSIVGPRELKGVPEAVDVFEVNWTPTRPHPNRSADVTRAHTMLLPPLALSLISQLWSDAAAGESSAALVIGQIGVADIVSALDASRGVNGFVLTADARSEGEGGCIPRALDGYFASCSAALARMQLGAHADAVAAYVPELRTRLATLSGRKEVLSARTAAELFALAAAEAPLVIVVEGADRLGEHDVSIVEALMDVVSCSLFLVLLSSSDDRHRVVGHLDVVLRHGGVVIDVPVNPTTKQSDGSGSDQLTTRFSEATSPPATLTLPTGARIALDPTATIIGRGSDCAVRLDDQDVSRHHAVLKAVGPNWVITDQGSTNGTEVNGELIQDSVLKNGDEITLGNTRLTFAIATPA